jgi:uncharacterized protein DUF2252
MADTAAQQDGVAGDEPMSRARADAGRALRKRVPRSSHALWEPGPDRAPLRVLEETNRRRVPELVTIREARMRASPFAFLRGAPAVMAADLATTPVTGIPRRSAATPTCSTSGCSPPRSATWSSASTTSTRPCRGHWTPCPG